MMIIGESQAKYIDNANSIMWNGYNHYWTTDGDVAELRWNLTNEFFDENDQEQIYKIPNFIRSYDINYEFEIN